MNSALLLLLLGVCAVAVAQKMNGMVFAASGADAYDNNNSDLSLEAVRKTKADWVSVVFDWWQTNIDSTEIFSSGGSPSTASLTHFTQKAKSLGFKVMFKPHVDLTNDPSHWRGQIGTNFNSGQWQTWFASYQSYMSYASKLAQSLGADLFIVGTELVESDPQEALWRQTIAGIRSNFKGPLVYGANWSPLQISWWDAVDYIGVDAYFPLASYQNPPVSTIMNGWNGPMSTIEAIVNKYNKKVIFTEIGYQSNSATAMSPAGASGGSLSIQAQANCYQAFFEKVYPQSWVAGVFWWAWSNNPYDGGMQDGGFTPHNKTASSVLAQYYN